MRVTAISLVAVPLRTVHKGLGQKKQKCKSEKKKEDHIDDAILKVR